MKVTTGLPSKKWSLRSCFLPDSIDTTSCLERKSVCSSGSRALSYLSPFHWKLKNWFLLIFSFFFWKWMFQRCVGKEVPEYGNMQEKWTACAIAVGVASTNNICKPKGCYFHAAATVLSQNSWSHRNGKGYDMSFDKQGSIFLLLRRAALNMYEAFVSKLHDRLRFLLWHFP